MIDYSFLLTGDWCDEMCAHCPRTDFGDSFSSVNTHPDNLCEGSSCEEAEEYYHEFLMENLTMSQDTNTILDVIYNNRTTILKSADGKTIVTCAKDDEFDFEKGFLIAFAQRVLGLSKSEYARMRDALEEKHEASKNHRSNK